MFAGLISSEISSWLEDDCLLPGSSHGHLFVPLWVLDFSFCKETSHIDLKTTHITYLEVLSHLFKTPLSTHSHILRCWVSGLQHTDFGEIQFSSKHLLSAS